MNHIKRSTKHHWLTKLRWRFVEPKTVLAVFRDEQFHRLLDPGYHAPINKWKERYADKPISLEARFVSVNDVQIFTTDCIKAEINLNVLFQFDPRKCTLPHNVPNVIDYSNFRLEKLVTNICSKVIRSTCATFEAIQLVSGAYRQRLEGKLTAHIQRQLQSFGVLLVGHTPVSIHSISLPKDIEYEWQKAVQRQIYASSLGEHTEESTKAIFRQELLANSDSIKLNIRQDNLSSIADTPSLQNTIPNGHKRYRNLSQSAN